MIDKLRKVIENRFSPEEFAKKYNFPVKDVYKWLSGKKDPSVRLYRVLRNDFGIDLNWLFESDFVVVDRSADFNRDIYTSRMNKLDKTKFVGKEPKK